MSKSLVSPLCLAAGIALLQPLAALAQDASGPDEHAIVSLEKEFLQARVTGNASSIRSSFASDGVFIHDNGDERSWSGLEAELSGRSYWLAVDRSEATINLYHNAAVTHAVLGIRLGGGQIDKVRTTGVYARQDGVWRIVSWQSTPLLPPDPPTVKR